MISKAAFMDTINTSIYVLNLKNTCYTGNGIIRPSYFTLLYKYEKRNSYKGPLAMYNADI